MLHNIKEFVKNRDRYQADIILVIGVILISLLSFAVGFITAKTYDKEPLRFEKVNEAEASFPSAFLFNKNLFNESSYYRSGN